MGERLLSHCGENILDKYLVKLYPRAYQDLDSIYAYIASHLLEPATASKMIEELEDAILSLEILPERGSIRRIGAYANQNYRQIFHKNYIIIYRVWHEKKEVHVITMRYAPSNF